LPYLFSFRAVLPSLAVRIALVLDASAMGPGGGYVAVWLGRVNPSTAEKNKKAKYLRKTY